MTERETFHQVIAEKKLLLPKVGIIMGSDSDLPVMKDAAEVLEELDVPHEVGIVSAHRTPEVVYEYARSAHDRGLEAIIAGAGGAAHLPGMTAAETHLPVIGVPVKGKAFEGMDSLLSIVQMPPGVPVATVSVNGARNAGILAAQILAISNPELAERIKEQKRGLNRQVREKNQSVQLDYKEHLRKMGK